MTENNALAGRVTLITGGGGEIGGAIAQRFAAAGAAIMIADIRRDSAETMAATIVGKGGQAAAVRANVAVPEDAEKSVRHAVERFGKLTTLVNVAANVTPDGTVETLTLEDWNDALAVNLTGAFLMCKYAVPEMRKAGGGTIVNIASQLGQIGVPGRAPYSTSKAALIQFTKCLANACRSCSGRDDVETSQAVTNCLFGALGAMAAAQGKTSLGKSIAKATGR